MVTQLLICVADSILRKIKNVGKTVTRHSWCSTTELPPLARRIGFEPMTVRLDVVPSASGVALLAAHSSKLDEQLGDKLR
jgi:hypothetical protein